MFAAVTLPRPTCFAAANSDSPCSGVPWRTAVVLPEFMASPQGSRRLTAVFLPLLQPFWRQAETASRGKTLRAMSARVAKVFRSKSDCSASHDAASPPK